MMLRVLPREALDGLATRAECLAFWINLYNTLVAEGLAALGLRATIWERPTFFEEASCRIGSLVWSLDDIEHGVLRGNRPSPLGTAPPFAPNDPRLAAVLAPLDPRIHCAISCGARSCPAVRRYEAAQLDAELEAATRAFVGREVTLEHGGLVLSEIFKWYRADFAAAPGGLAPFLLRHAEDAQVRQALERGGLERATWRPYDWRLAAAEAEP
jgi:hypothetical protein